MSKQAFMLISDDLFLLNQSKQKMIADIQAKLNVEVVRLTCTGSERLEEDIKAATIPDLFSPNKLIVITAAEGKWHLSTTKALDELLSTLSKNPNLYILIALCELKAQQLKTKTIQKLQSYCQVKTIKVPVGMQKLQWINKHAKQFKLTIQQDALQEIDLRTNGHLYACDQLFQKCHLLGIDTITLKSLDQLIGNFSKYTIYDYMTSLCKGDQQSQQILDYLQGQKVATTLILWNIINILRLTYNISFQVHKLGIPYALASKKLWFLQKTDVELLFKRLNQSQLLDLLQQAFSLDKIIKSKGEAETWSQLAYLNKAILAGKVLCHSV